MKTGSVIRSRTSYQQLDNESDKEKQPLFAILGRPYTITWIMATSIGLVAVVLTGRGTRLTGRSSQTDNPGASKPKPPASVNILTALAENERIAKTNNDPGRRANALSWLFHLVGDIHQPLHSAQIFTTDYPNGDRGGNAIYV